MLVAGPSESSAITDQCDSSFDCCNEYSSLACFRHYGIIGAHNPYTLYLELIPSGCAQKEFETCELELVAAKEPTRMRRAKSFPGTDYKSPLSFVPPMATCNQRGCLAHLYPLSSPKPVPVHVKANPFSIGREGTNLVVDSATRKLLVSRHHATISMEVVNGEQKWKITDNNSVNGLLINLRRVKESPLRTGDRIHFGNFIVIVIYFHCSFEMEGGAANVPVGTELRFPGSDVVYQFEGMIALLLFVSDTSIEIIPTWSQSSSTGSLSSTPQKTPSLTSTPSLMSPPLRLAATQQYSLTSSGGPSLSSSNGSLSRNGSDSQRPSLAITSPAPAPTVPPMIIDDDMPMPQGTVSKKAPSDWNVDDVINWLSTFIPASWFRTYKPVFENEGIDGERLLSFTEDELKNDLKIDKFSLRREIMLGVRRLTLQEELNAPEASQQQADEDPLQNAQSIESSEAQEEDVMPTIVDLGDDAEKEDARVEEDENERNSLKSKKKRKPYVVSDSESELEISAALKHSVTEPATKSRSETDELSSEPVSKKRVSDDDFEEDEESEAIETPEPKKSSKKPAAKKKDAKKKSKKQKVDEEPTEPPTAAQQLALEDLAESIQAKRIDALELAIASATKFKVRSPTLDEARELLEHLREHPDEQAPEHEEEDNTIESQARQQLQHQVDRELQQLAQPTPAKAAAASTSSAQISSATSAVPAVSSVTSTIPPAESPAASNAKAAEASSGKAVESASATATSAPATPSPSLTKPSGSVAKPAEAVNATSLATQSTSSMKPLYGPEKIEQTDASSPRFPIVASPDNAGELTVLHEEKGDTPAAKRNPVARNSLYDETEARNVVTITAASRGGGGSEWNMPQHSDDAFIHGDGPISDGAVPRSEVLAPEHSLTPLSAAGLRFTPVKRDDSDEVSQPPIIHSPPPPPERPLSHGSDSPPLQIKTEGPVQINNIITNILQMQQDLKEEAAAPEKLTASLFPFQKQSLAWMIKREKTKPYGGILADEMGLGKTVQTIACMLANCPTSGGPHMTLIVCPLSCLFQWRDELLGKTKEGTWTIHAYHGPGKVQHLKELCKYDVVLTTYSTLAMEIPKDHQPGSSRHFLGPLFKVHWFRVVLDEAHSIKNRQTRQAKACYSLESKVRWALSATPIQNTVDDMYSLFRFLRHDTYSEYANWKSFIGNYIKSRRPEQGLKRLRAVLSEFLICRTKNTKDANGKAIVELPSRTVFIRRDKFTAPEWDFYQALWTSSKVQFDAYLRQGTVIQNYTNILVMLTRLRQACDHPALVLRDRIWRKGDAPPTTTASSMCYLCNDLLGEEVGITPCGHQFCRDCLLDALADNDRAPRCAYPNCGRNFTESDIQAMSNAHPARRSDSKAGVGEIESSTKIEVLLRELRVFHSQAPDTKGIIFSQWTSMLDLIEPVLTKEGYKFVRLDGSMSLNNRRAAIQTFKEDPQVRLFLISLKAGGLGLNLTVANYVFMLDLWWNPAVEDQAIDRVHRVGQMRGVQVVRFTIENTIEDRILELQARKRQIAEGALGKTDGKGVNPYGQKLTIQELAHLFSEAGDARPEEGEPERAPEALLVKPMSLLPPRPPPSSQMPLLPAPLPQSSPVASSDNPVSGPPKQPMLGQSTLIAKPPGLSQSILTAPDVKPPAPASSTAADVKPKIMGPSTQSTATSQNAIVIQSDSEEEDEEESSPYSAPSDLQFFSSLAPSRRQHVDTQEVLKKLAEQLKKPAAAPAPALAPAAKTQRAPALAPAAKTQRPSNPVGLSLSVASKPQQRASTSNVQPRVPAPVSQVLLANQAQASANNWRSKMPMNRRLTLRTEYWRALRNLLRNVVIPIDQVQQIELSAWNLATSVQDYLQRLRSGFMRLQITLQEHERARVLSGRNAS